MSRLFSKTDNDYFSIPSGTWGAAAHGAAAVSAHIWAYPTVLSQGGANDNRAFAMRMPESTAAAFFLNVDAVGGGSLIYLRVGGRSQEGDPYESVTGNSESISTNTWHALGGVLDFADDRVVAYVDGVKDAENSSATGWGSATFVGNVTPDSNPDALPTITATSDDRWTGRLGHAASWDIDIGDAAFQALAAGVSPLLIYPEHLIFYFPMEGTGNIVDSINGYVGTENGTGGIGQQEGPLISLPTVWPVTHQYALVGDIDNAVMWNATEAVMWSSTEVVTWADNAAGGGTTGVLRQAVDSTRHGFQPVMASRLGGVLVH